MIRIRQKTCPGVVTDKRRDARGLTESEAQSSCPTSSSCPLRLTASCPLPLPSVSQTKISPPDVPLARKREHGEMAQRM